MKKKLQEDSRFAKNFKGMSTVEIVRWCRQKGFTPCSEPEIVKIPKTNSTDETNVNESQLETINKFSSFSVVQIQKNIIDEPTNIIRPKIGERIN